MIIRLTCVNKLRIRLENFNGVFARVSMGSDRLYFASLEIHQSYSLTLPPWKNLCHRWSRDQPRPGSLFQRPREEEKRDPGNEVVSCLARSLNRNVATVDSSKHFNRTGIFFSVLYTLSVFCDFAPISWRVSS